MQEVNNDANVSRTNVLFTNMTESSVAILSACGVTEGARCTIVPIHRE